MSFFKCDLCKTDNIHADLFNGDIEFPLKPIRGINPFVMLLGQDPTITKGKVSSVLDLENEKGVLFKYLVKEILEKSGLSLDNVYATNLVKCRFPNNQTPNLISKNNHKTITAFLLPFFNNCRKWLYSEIEEIKPKIIISLGQPVHQMLVQELDWEIPIRMKEAFGKIYPVKLSGSKIEYAPCIHINSMGHKHYKNAWPGFINNLKDTVASLK